MAQKYVAREKLSPDEIWRRFPPEEKIELLNKSHAAGASAVLVSILVAATIGISLEYPWLLWSAMICSPLVFQFAAGRMWRRTQPYEVLHYLAARLVARRFAFTINSKELTTRILFKAQLVSREHRADDIYDQASEEGETEDVWVALFGDALVIMAGGRSGAEVRLARLIDDRLQVSAVSPPREKEYSSRREITISYRENRTKTLKSFCLRSRYPAALMVFEKYLLAEIEAFEKAKAELQAQLEAQAALAEEPVEEASTSGRKSYF